MTNQQVGRQLRELIARASTLEFGPVGTLEFFPKEKVLGVDKKFVFYAFAKSKGAYHTVEESLLALVCTTEHLSAINRRKQLISSGELDPVDDLHVLNVLLSSHLHKHNKSPMLWQHRRWILAKYPRLFNLETELTVLGYAADRHPLNYYAFAYARWMVQSSLESRDLDRVCDWCWDLCYYHISDTSIWGFLSIVDTSSKYKDRATLLLAEYKRPAIAGYLAAIDTIGDRE